MNQVQISPKNVSVDFLQLLVWLIRLLFITLDEHCLELKLLVCHFLCSSYVDMLLIQFRGFGDLKLFYLVRKQNCFPS